MHAIIGPIWTIEHMGDTSRNSSRLEKFPHAIVGLTMRAAIAALGMVVIMGLVILALTGTGVVSTHLGGEIMQDGMIATLGICVLPIPAMLAEMLFESATCGY